MATQSWPSKEERKWHTPTSQSALLSHKADVGCEHYHTFSLHQYAAILQNIQQMYHTNYYKQQTITYMGYSINSHSSNNANHKSSSSNPKLGRETEGH